MAAAVHSWAAASFSRTLLKASGGLDGRVRLGLARLFDAEGSRICALASSIPMSESTNPVRPPAALAFSIHQAALPAAGYIHRRVAMRLAVLGFEVPDREPAFPNESRSRLTRSDVSHPGMFSALILTAVAYASRAKLNRRRQGYSRSPWR